MLAKALTISIISHNHGRVVDDLVQKMDSLPSLTGVRVIVTANVGEERFEFESYKPRNLNISVVRNLRPLGFGANHNQAFATCTTPWFAIVNPDILVAEDVFSSLVQLGHDTGSALIAPRVLGPSGHDEDSVRWNLTPFSLLKRWIGIPGENNVNSRGFRWFAGMFYLVRSDDFRKIGGFDTRFFLYCEDFDLCARLSIVGYKLLFTQSLFVVHDARRSSRSSLKFLTLHINSLLKVWFHPLVWRIALRDIVIWVRDGLAKLGSMKGGFSA